MCVYVSNTLRDWSPNGFSNKKIISFLPSIIRVSIKSFSLSLANEREPVGSHWLLNFSSSVCILWKQTHLAEGKGYVKLDDKIDHWNSSKKLMEMTSL